RFKQLFIQFLGESLLITFLAFLISIAITELALPFFETLMDLELTVPYTSPESYLFALLLVTSVGISGGLYPAFILSRFSPARALKANQTTEADDSFKLRNILVIFQFTASIILIIATAVAYFQLLYTIKRDPGFNPDNLIVVEGIMRRDFKNYGKALQQELLKLPEVIKTGLSSMQPSRERGTYSFENKLMTKPSSSKQDQGKLINSMYVDYDFFNTYEISLLSGRYFSRDLDQEEPAPNWFSALNKNNEEKKNNEEIKDRRIIINVAAAKQLGYTSADEAVGEIIVHEGQQPGYPEYSIIGVVENSQFRDIRLQPGPEFYRLGTDVTGFLTVKYRGEYKAALKEVKSVWHKVIGDIPFSSGNVKQNMAITLAREERENKVLISFALLAISIACMGLYGMASFTVDRRVKEIGLRKVMGAKVKDIKRLLVWKFLKPVLLANIIAWPVAILVMQNWAERFPYSLKPLFMVLICIGSGLIALLIAWFTVAGNTKRVAKSNPVHALRYE
ncbi:FtsX-like permease family protein, partial [Thermodesulfobacteriota bacterium]